MVPIHTLQSLNDIKKKLKSGKNEQGDCKKIARR